MHQIDFGGDKTKNSAKRDLKGVRIVVAAILLSLCSAHTFQELPASPQVETATIDLGQGVEFYQVDFEFTEATFKDSNWGRITADPVLLAEYTGITEGFLNVFTDYGWVVQNLSLSATDGLGPITTYFNLGLPVLSRDVATLSAYVSYSTEQYFELQRGFQTEYPVGTAIWNAEGVDEATREISAAPPLPPEAPPLPPEVLSREPSIKYTLPNPVNVQAADEQCYPMAIANSLQYLEETFGLNVPHDHVPGLKGDNTLVGQLDTEADRWVKNRGEGGGVSTRKMLEGKFSYLNNNGLKDMLIHRHQGRILGVPVGDFTRHGITSIDDGQVVTWGWICTQIRKGADVELGYNFKGHVQRVFGYEITGGTTYIYYLHDANQSDDNDGLESVRMEVRDMDGDGFLNLGSKDWEIGIVLSESVAKPYLKGVYSTHKLHKDGVVEMYIRVVSGEYSGKVYDIEIFPTAQSPFWESVVVMEAPTGWESEEIGDGVRFYTKENPLVTCQRTRFIFRVRAQRISWYIRVHLTGKDGENLGEIISKRFWFQFRLLSYPPYVV